MGSVKDRAFRKEGPAMPPVVICPYCGQVSALVKGDKVYPKLKDLHDKFFYVCAPCDARVGCHPPSTSPRGGIGDGTVPMGRLANGELRSAKVAAHHAFDSLHTEGFMTRSQSYVWLARTLGLKRSDCHIGMFDVSQCLRVVRVVNEFKQQKNFSLNR